MTALTSDPTLGTTATIGRYFGVVSVVPSLFFVIWSYLLVACQPWNGPPDYLAIRAGNPLESVALGLALVLVALVVAVVTHPLQFLAVQLLEGYWGPSPLARKLQEHRILAHLQRRQALERTLIEASDALDKLATKLGESSPAEIDWPSALDGGDVTQLLSAKVAETRSRAAIGLYPELHSNVMATRLGNVLRRYEASAGAAVNLDIVKWANHIGMIADPAHTAYVQDQRNSMDLAVRMTMTCSSLFALTFFMLWPHGFWLLTALVPLAGALLSYQGSIIAADSYGRALTSWLQLNRFRLYDALNLPPVHSASLERTQNDGLEDLVLGQPEYNSRYRKYAPPPPKT